MQRIITGLLLIPALALLTGLTGCGKEDKPKYSAGSKLPPLTTDVVKTEGPKEIIKPGKAKIVGRVVYDGTPTQPTSLTDRMQEHGDKATCLAGNDSEKRDQTWFVGKDGGVANAVIWVNAPAGKEFEVQNENADAVLDQPHCAFIPHVLAVKPGQKLKVMNSSPVAHNTKLVGNPLVNKEISPTIGPKQSIMVDVKPQDTPINVGCDFHRWMQAKIWVLPHQYVAVTKEDGSFTIDNVPDGVELSVVAWHEGGSPNFFGEGGKKGMKTKFNAGDNKLELKVK